MSAQTSCSGMDDGSHRWKGSVVPTNLYYLGRNFCLDFNAKYSITLVF